MVLMSTPLLRAVSNGHVDAAAVLLSLVETALSDASQRREREAFHLAVLDEQRNNLVYGCEKVSDFHLTRVLPRSQLTCTDNPGSSLKWPVQYIYSGK